jgi:hypothetical protein
MTKYILIILLLSFSSTVFAIPLLTDLNYVLQAPPTTENPLTLYNYLNTLYQRWNVLQISNKEPNGSIDADYGQNIIYFDGSNYWISIETTIPHGTTWVGTKLGSV